MKFPSRLFAILAAVACVGLCVMASVAQAAAPAWKPIAASGPTNLPPVQDEIQRVAIDAEGGTFDLTAYHPIASGTGNTSGSSITSVEVKSGTFAAGQEVVGPGIAPGTTITAVSNLFGSIFITLSAPVSGGTGLGVEFFAVDDSETTPPLAFDASAAEVRTALNALSSISAFGASVSVEGGPGGKNATDPYFVTFGGSASGVNQPELLIDSNGLTGAEGHDHGTVTTAVDGGPGTTEVAIYAQNVGGLPSTGTTTITLTLPAGITTEKAIDEKDWVCSPSSVAGMSEATCNSIRVAPQGFTLPPLLIPVVAGPGAETGTVHIEVSGGGATRTAEYDMPLVVSAMPARPGVQSFSAGAYDENGMTDTRAGAHPYSGSTGILINTKRSPRGIVVPVGEFRNIIANLPPGFLGNPIAAGQCPEYLEQEECDQSSIVGTVQIPLESFGKQGELSTVNNIEAPYGSPGKFRFLTGLKYIIVNVLGALRSDEDYGLEVGSFNTPQIKSVFGTFFTFWGSPADASHDGQRCKSFVGTGTEFGEGRDCVPGGNEVAFLTLGTNCAEQAAHPPSVGLDITTWQQPGEIFSNTTGIPPVTGCDSLHFDANFTFEPSDTRSDSTASFRTSLTVPSEGLTDPTKLTTPEIRKDVVQLPQGVVLNPSAADGLQACSEQQIGFMGANFPLPNPMRFDKDPNQCPEASKIGSGELKTALLEEPLHGALYLAAQGNGNPFGSLFAVYLVIEDPRHGIFIKLPGKVEPDPRTGQMTVTFENLPQVPFTRLDLSLKGGNRSALATPTTCGNYVTTATNTPWSAPESGPPTISTSSFHIDQGPNGGACAKSAQERPFDLGFTAGSSSAAAGASSPFDIRITRPGGAQELTNLDIVTPAGLTATLKGVPYCTEDEIHAAEARSGSDEQTNPACPAASQVGTTQVGAGAGSTPFYAPGKLYLAGPYKGAPLSIVAITPALAGPFDLGDVVVRTALFVNPETAQITAKSDPLPEFLKGVQLRIRDVRIMLDRSDFTLNPTSCEPKSVDVTVHGNSGAVAHLSQHYQAEGCADLPFAPNLKLKVLGGTKRNAKPRLRAVVTAKPGEANISAAQVNLPHSEFLEQNHIKTVCTRVQFAEGDGNGSACPAGSIYGRAKAWTPLLDHPLEGNVYLRSNGGERKLPDVVAALDGQVDIALWGKVDSGPNHGIRNTFEVVPDAPVSQFELEMYGGKRGLLVNSENLCSKKAKRRAIARFTGQNGKVHQFKPVVQNRCKKHRKHGKHHKSHTSKRPQSRVIGRLRRSGTGR